MTKTYTYTLECGHIHTATVADNDTSAAYTVGQKIVCPKDHYAFKKIVEQTVT